MDTQIRMERNFMADSSTIPPFINTRKENHKRSYYIAQNIHNVLLVLFKDVILDATIIEDVFVDVAELIQEIIDLDANLALDYLIYFKDILYHYKQQSIESELYEVSSNLTTFLEIYEKIKT